MKKTRNEIFHGAMLPLLMFVMLGSIMGYAESDEELRKKAAKGDAVAQFDLGVRYAERSVGEGNPWTAQTHFAEAWLWFERAAEQDWIHSEADQGNAWGQVVLGMMYHKGRGMPKDESEAARWIRCSAEQGNAKATPFQSEHWYKEAISRGVPESCKASALGLLHKKAIQGDAEAQFNLGVRYAEKAVSEEGDVLGSRANFEEAVRWFVHAAKQGWPQSVAEQGNAWGQLALGIMHELGRGAPKDEVEAKYWYLRAAEQGNAEAQYLLGIMYEAQNRLGFMSRDKRDVPQDNVEAARWIRCATEQGHERAQHNQSREWYKRAMSQSVPENCKASAMELLRKKATKGDAEAQFDLGAKYAERAAGESGPWITRPSFREAMHWSLRAAEQGRPQSVAEQGNAWGQLALGIMYDQGRSATKDKDEARRWYLRAAKQGNVEAQFLLGIMYVAVPSSTWEGHDSAKAACWVRSAAEQGHERAQREQSQWWYKQAISLGVPENCTSSDNP